MSEIKTFRKGDVLLKEGTTGSPAYIIISGSVEVNRMVNGKKLVFTTLESGNIIGDMELITGMPRLTSVTALEDTITSSVNRDTFESMILEDPDSVVHLLIQVYHRLHHTKQLVMDLYEKAGVNGVDRLPGAINLKALTKEAKNALGKDSIEISKTPFFIGRATRRTPFEAQDLSLIDREPYEISRNHCVIDFSRDECQIIDTGSTMGTTVDGVRIGKKGAKKSMPLKSGTHCIVLGGPKSSYVFELQVP